MPLLLGSGKERVKWSNEDRVGPVALLTMSWNLINGVLVSRCSTSETSAKCHRYQIHKFDVDHCFTDIFLIISSLSYIASLYFYILLLIPNVVRISGRDRNYRGQRKPQGGRRQLCSRTPRPGGMRGMLGCGSGVNTLANMRLGTPPK
jgi:hypothetical protein